MDRTQPITLDRKEAIDGWIDALQSNRDCCGVQMDTVARATLRITGRSDRTYTLPGLWEVFVDSTRRRAFLHTEREASDTDIDTLATTDDDLLHRLARRTQPHVEQQSAE